MSVSNGTVLLLARRHDHVVATATIQGVMAALADNHFLARTAVDHILPSRRQVHQDQVGVPSEIVVIEQLVAIRQQRARADDEVGLDRLRARFGSSTRSGVVSASIIPVITRLPPTRRHGAMSRSC